MLVNCGCVGFLRYLFPFTGTHCNFWVARASTGLYYLFLKGYLQLPFTFLLFYTQRRFKTRLFATCCNVESPFCRGNAFTLRQHIRVVICSVVHVLLSKSLGKVTSIQISRTECKVILLL